MEGEKDSMRHPSPSLPVTLKMKPTPEVIYFLLKLIVTSKKHGLRYLHGDPPSEQCEARMCCGEGSSI